MLRLAVAVAIIVTIFLHSPERRGGAPEAGLGGWSGPAQAGLLTDIFGASAGRSIADAALRRTLAEVPKAAAP